MTAPNTDLATKLALVENLLWIVDKDATMQRFKLNKAQKWLPFTIW